MPGLKPAAEPPPMILGLRPKPRRYGLLFHKPARSAFASAFRRLFKFAKGHTKKKTPLAARGLGAVPPVYMEGALRPTGHKKDRQPKAVCLFCGPWQI